MKVWVIGGTSGIGKACTTVLRSAGHQVEASGSEVDVRRGGILSAYASIRGPFDGLVYSAGVNWLDWVQDLDTDEALRLYDINVLGLVRAVQETPEVSRVVVVGSDAAWRPMRTSVAYNASKAALHAAVQCIARERGSDAFSINVVAPGLTEGTEMTDYVRERTGEIRGWSRESLDDYMVAQIPLGRPAEPVEVAYVVRDVLEWPAYVNGAIIPVNGGR
jgi:NAD(P)-dependent dehydrogenase (short-subunit alcohol dehydrogenase family)